MTVDHDLRRLITQSMREGKNFPNIHEVCAAMNFSEDQARKYMGSLYEDGYLEKIGDWYRLPEEKISIEEDTLILEDTPDFEEITSDKPKRGRPFGSTKKVIEPPQASPEPQREALNPRQYDLQIKIIQVAMGLVGVGAAIINIYYTSTWSLEFLPWPLAFLLSFIMVSFTVFAFEVMVIFASGAITDNRIVKSAVIGGFSLLWVVAILFSTSNTIAGQVNKQFKNGEGKVIASDHNTKEQWRILQEQKQDAKQRLNDYRDQIKTYNQVLSGMNSVKSRKENKGTWNDVNYKLQKTQKDMAKISDEMDDIRLQEKKVLEESKKKGGNVVENTEKTLSFFEWLAKTIGASPDKIQLFLAILPAAFSEIIAPFGIAVAMFLHNKS